MTVAIAKEDTGNVDLEHKKKKGKSKSKVEDSTSEAEVKQHKKKSKKRKHEELESEQPVIAESKDIPEAGEEVLALEKKKKKKKRSHDAEDVEMQPAEEVTNGEAVESEKKDKKKGKKDKKDKKEKKDKKKSSKDTTDSQATTTAESSKSSSPSRSKAPKASPSEASQYLSENSITIHVPPGQPEVVPILAFDQLDIPDSLRSFSAKFKEPSPIQACAWPPSLDGKDVVGIAETGSGKTLAFGIPALSRLITSPPASGKGTSTITTLVLAPTRELALQTHETLSTLGKPLGIACVAVFGGVPKEPQVQMLQNLDKGKTGLTTRVIVGTPGRILDLMNDGVCDLSGVNFLVLDEADRMLDKGFENDIRKIISHTKPSKERQTLMFSATWPEAVRRLASTFQNKPVRVTVGSDDLTANRRVEQSVEVLDDSRQKDSRLLHHLRNLGHPKRPTGSSDEARIIVFALYKKETSRVEQMLIREGYATSALHGDINQNARIQALEKFKTGQTGILVATDVAARGLDIPNVKAVINYTYPLTTEDYIHRIGRTGRGGQNGKSITFFTGENQERGLAGELLRVLKDSGFDCPDLQRFPTTIKKKEHSAYGAFFRDDIPVTERKKIVF
ncbi:RNA-dependent ATPase [Paramarasmius palmivorus]|uniref:RNA helicase n=1 Tax=Paramarasmius palmivorus TaxID=297713 RepID=A0AAW0CU32_9AGAR